MTPVIWPQLPPRPYREGMGTGALIGVAFMNAFAGAWLALALSVAVFAALILFDRSRNWYGGE